MSCGVGCRRGSDPTLLCLWCRLAATVLIQPLAWEPPCAARAAQEIAKIQKKKEKKKKKEKYLMPTGVRLKRMGSLKVRFRGQTLPES